MLCALCEVDFPLYSLCEIREWCWCVVCCFCPVVCEDLISAVGKEWFCVTQSSFHECWRAPVLWSLDGGEFGVPGVVVRMCKGVPGCRFVLEVWYTILVGFACNFEFINTASVFTLLTSSMDLSFTVTCAPQIVSHMRIFPLNQHAWRSITFRMVSYRNTRCSNG